MGGLFGNLVSKSESCSVQNKTKTNEEQSEIKRQQSKIKPITKPEQNRKEKEVEKEREVESEYDSITPNPSFDLTDDEPRIEVLDCFFFL